NIGTVARADHKVAVAEPELVHTIIDGGRRCGKGRCTKHQRLFTADRRDAVGTLVGVGCAGNDYTLIRCLHAILAFHGKRNDGLFTREAEYVLDHLRGFFFCQARVCRHRYFAPHTAATIDDLIGQVVKRGGIVLILFRDVDIHWTDRLPIYLVTGHAIASFHAQIG